MRADGTESETEAHRHVATVRGAGCRVRACCTCDPEDAQRRYPASLPTPSITSWKALDGADHPWYHVSEGAARLLRVLRSSSTFALAMSQASAGRRSASVAMDSTRALPLDAWSW